MTDKTPAKDNTVNTHENREVYRPLRIFWSCLENRIFFCLIFVMSLVTFGCVGFMSIYFGEFIDSVTVLKDVDSTLAAEDIFKNVIGGITVIIILNILCNVFSRSIQAFEIYSIPKALANMRRILTRDAMIRNPDFFKNEMAGSISHRIASVPLALRQFIHFFQWTGIGEGGYIALTIWFAYDTHTLLGHVMFAWVIVFTIQNITLMNKYFRPAAHDLAKKRGRFTGRVTDIVGNALVVVMHGLNRKISPDLSKTIVNERKSFQKMRLISMFYQGAMGITEVIFLSCLMIAGAHYMVSGEISVGAYVAVIMLSFRATQSLWQIGIELPSLFENWTTVKEGMEFLSAYDIAEKDDVDTGSDIAQVNSSAPSLSFNDVSFSYLNSTTLFDGLSIEIQSGERIGLIGYSGAGKTTLVNLLLRFYEPTVGAIAINGLNIADIPHHIYRSQFSVIPQDTSLFHRSIKDNISFGVEGVSDTDIIEAAKKAHAHDFIMAMNHGYDSIVGERGVKLSGGQRQRIAIARAFLRNAPILVLDEATSALDSQTEHLIQQSLSELMINKTVIVIAHRLSTVSQLDRILVMDEGSIIEQGSHENLLRNKSVYADMWDLQSGQLKP